MRTPAIGSLRRTVRRCLRGGTGAMALAVLAWVGPASAQQQFQGVCANVKIEIDQELAIERIGFEATLEITNNVGGDPITDFSAALTFSDPSNTTDGVAADAGDLFFVQQPRLTEVNAVDGTGVIGPTKTAIIKWFIIPKPGAGGTQPQGKTYQVGVNLNGKMAGVEIPKTIFYAIPDTITVKPEPELNITYFQPRDVQGDDPFTPEVESPIPFTLGVLVKNSGYGTARSVTINSQQPKIVENKAGLVLVARLLGTRVQDSPLNEASLQVNLGDIPPSQTRKGAWDMITSLSGEFIEFKASYTHRDDLGGLETSLIKSLNAYFISHEVLDDDPGRDKILDFLADTDRDDMQMPDSLYESEGQVLPVNAEADASVTTPLANRTFVVSVNRTFAGWGYVRLTDPGQAKLGIQSVVRNDGKVINPHNVWTNIRYRYPDNFKLTYFNLLDKVDAPGAYTYTVTYAVPPADTTPPVTRLRFSGQVTESSGNYYITRDTQMYFTSDDASPVSIEDELDDATTFSPAIPFTLTTPGAHVVRFRATDTAGNVEATQTATLVLPSSGPAFGDIAVGSDALTVTGDTMSFRPTQIALSIPVSSSSVGVAAQVDIFRGVRVWPTLAGVPVSPTPSGTTALAVGGLDVDFYKYRLNAGAWSAERTVATPISLSGLSGSVSLDVLGRSQFGGYPTESDAVHATWTVDAQAPQFTISGLPPIPTRYPIPALTVTAPGVDLYRWTIDDSYWRAEAAPGTSFDVPLTTAGTHTLKLVAQRSGTWQSDTAPTTWTWLYDPAYGSDLSSLTKVYSKTYTAVQGTSIAFTWDGRDGSGVTQLPGYYTVRIQLTDDLGNTTFTNKIVRIDDLVTSVSAVTAPDAGGEKPDARGNWLVWQERGSGTPNIRALNVGPGGGTTLAITNGVLAQENPRTDGRNVVWQGRRENGNWDVFYADLTDPTHVVALTDTPSKNEVKPVIDWPWVVWQVKDTSDSSAPWQLQAANMDTGQLFMVNPSAADELDPAVQAGRVVWQDFRDVGYGEIYFRDLETGEQRRLTNNGFGQYAPDIQGNWVVWQDNRNTEVDIYGYDLRRMAETRLTNTPGNEARPRLAGNWTLFTEDSAGVLSDNFVLYDVSTGHSVPLTRTASAKSSGTIAGGQLIWQDGGSGASVVKTAAVPALQSVFRNYNAVPVTAALAAKYKDAFTLLQGWNADAGVVAVTRFRSFAPLASDAASITDGSAIGTNFALTPGEFLWVRFNDQRLLDLGDAGNAPLNLPAGTSAFTRTQLPVNYTGYALARSLGLSNVHGLRVLDAEAGLWRTLAVTNGAIVGPDFNVPSVAVVIVDLNTAINGWAP